MSSPCRSTPAAPRAGRGARSSGREQRARGPGLRVMLPPPTRERRVPKRSRCLSLFALRPRAHRTRAHQPRAGRTPALLQHSPLPTSAWRLHTTCAGLPPAHPALPCCTEHGVYTGSSTTMALCGFVRSQAESDSALDRLWCARESNRPLPQWRGCSCSERRRVTQTRQNCHPRRSRPNRNKVYTDEKRNGHDI